MASTPGGAATPRVASRSISRSLSCFVVLALALGALGGIASRAGAQTTPTTAPTPADTGGSIGIVPPVSGPGRGAEPNGPQVRNDEVQAQATDANGEFTPVTPARILDTRNGIGGIATPFGPQQTSSIQAAGVGGVPADGVSAVVLNVTVTSTTSGSFLTLFPAATGLPPVASNLNWDAGATIANLVTVRVGGNGAVSIYNHAGSAHVVVDVMGFYATSGGPAGSRFHPLNPSRYFDTRDTNTPFLENQTRPWYVMGRNGVPASGVTAIVMNVTVTASTLGGYLTVFPGDVGAPPGTSNVNFLGGMTIPNQVIVRVPPSGLVNFFNAFGSVHVIADVVGWYDDDRVTESGRFIALNPTRIFDTRNTGSPIAGGSSRFVAVAAQGGVPAFGAGAVVMNVTATLPSEPSFLTVHPAGTPTPTASNLNFVSGQTIPNLVTVKLGAFGGASIFNRFGTVHVVADVAGYFTEVTFGFDACETPSVSTMNTWRQFSPYSSIGIYFGGGLRACANTALNNATWVNAVVAQGWRLIPTYVGAQAPCTGYSIRIDPNNAFAWGVDAANDAANRAAIAGLPLGAPLYFDIEAYNNADAACSLAVKQFVAGWVVRLHERGFKAGFYSSLNSGIADMVKAVTEGYPALDAIWIAAWNDTPNLFGFSQSVLPDSFWAFHQRIHQYRGGHDETWGGVTINIDTNVVDGPLAP